MVKLILGLVFINRLSIDLDEPFSIFHAQKELDELSQLFITENNPPLHFYLLHFWIKWFGISAFSVRSLSLIFSVLTLPLLFQIGKKLLYENLGLLLMLMFTFSNFHHSFGIEARTFSLFSFLFAALVLLLFQLREKIKWQTSLFLGVLCALLFYTHYISIIVIPFVFLIHILLNFKEKSSKSWLSFLVMLVVFSVALMPYLHIFMARLEHVQTAGTWVERPNWTLIYGFINKFFNGPICLLSLVVILIYLLIRKKIEFSKKNTFQWRSPIRILSMFTIGIYLSAFVISWLGNSSIFLDRYLFFLSIGFFGMLGYFALKLIDKNLKIMVLPLIVFTLGFNPFRTHNRESDKLLEYAQSFDGSYIISPTHYDLTFIYHGDKTAFQSLKEGHSLFERGIYPIHGLHEIELENLKKPIVLIDAGSEFLYGERKLLNDLSNQYKLIESKTFKGGYEVFVFD